MNILDELRGLMADTLTVEQPTTHNAYGEPVAYGAATAVPARIVGRLRMVRDLDGQERVSSMQAYVAGAYGLTVRHRYTLPSRFMPRQPEAVAVARVSDEHGAHHEVVYFR